MVSHTQFATVVALLFCATLVSADVYMHNPRGSNDRNCERNVNRRNANRLFDSQNNAKGGYACPRAVGGPIIMTPKMYYYVGSKLPIEWTSQHGCGSNPKEICQAIIQYACEDTLDPTQEFRSGSYVGAPRDGTPTDAADDATDTIPATVEAAKADTVANRRFGMHESIRFYNKCRTRSRNLGLFTADQRVRRRDARGTRQNPNGNRRGLECPEERDYYPYWHPTPWIDVAVLTSYLARCPYFQANSQNVKAVGECQPVNTGAADALKSQGRWYNNNHTCTINGHNWVEYKVQEGLDEPYCAVGSFGRINHLGNVPEANAPTQADLNAIPQRNNANRYIWTIPDHVNDNCVLRLRYNISTADYMAWELDGTPGYNASYNKQPPIQQDPFIDIGDDEDEFVSLALNTNQYGRTFQDRSYVFAIKPDPRTDAQKAADITIYNLNVRGKRGNIVQTYPAVEYDFVPNDLNINVGDLVHFQWTGSDYNPRRGCNDAEGGPPDGNPNHNSRADRSNLIEMTGMDMNMPRDITTSAALQGKTMFEDENGNPDMDTIMRLAFLDQKRNLALTGRRCMTREELQAINNKNARENSPFNCAKINAAYTPYFDGGLVTMRAKGAFTYFSSRNNNFSNRDQTGRICVGVTCQDGGPTTARGIDNTIDNGDGPVQGQIELAPVITEAQVENILADETFALNGKDNDAFGDGEEEDCEEMRWELDGISTGAAVALAFGMIVLGVVLTLAGQYAMRRYNENKEAALTGSYSNSNDKRKLVHRTPRSTEMAQSAPRPTPRRGGPPPIPPRQGI